MDTFPTPGGDNRDVDDDYDDNHDDDDHDDDDDDENYYDVDDDHHWLHTGILGLRPNTVICYRGEAYTHHR